MSQGRFQLGWGGTAATRLSVSGIKAKVVDGKNMQLIWASSSRGASTLSIPMSESSSASC